MVLVHPALATATRLGEGCPKHLLMFSGCVSPAKSPLSVLIASKTCTSVLAPKASDCYKWGFRTSEVCISKSKPLATGSAGYRPSRRRPKPPERESESGSPCALSLPERSHRRADICGISASLAGSLIGDPGFHFALPRVQSRG